MDLCGLQAKKEAGESFPHPAAASALLPPSVLQQMQPWLQMAESWQESSAEIKLLGLTVASGKGKLGHSVKARKDNC